MTNTIGRPVALVTGASRGIGKAVALRLANNGYDIVAVARSSVETWKDVIDEIKDAGGDCLPCQHDLEEIENVSSLLSHILTWRPAIHCLVNNAGVQTLARGDPLDLTVESFDHVLRVNLRGVWFLTQAIARHMRDVSTGSAQRSVIFITSSNAFVPAPSRSDYCMSKAGLAMAAQVLALRLAEFDVPVFEVRPGTIETDMTRDVIESRRERLTNGAIPQGRFGQPEDIANAVSLLANGGLSYSTGAVVTVDGGASIRPN